jgi:hypothetical protein
MIAVDHPIINMPVEASTPPAPIVYELQVAAERGAK